MESQKTERFRRVAAPRVQRVLDSLDNLAKCSNRKNYDYTDENVAKMLRAIKAKVKQLEHAFGSTDGASKPNKFSF